MGLGGHAHEIPNPAGIQVGEMRSLPLSLRSLEKMLPISTRDNVIEDTASRAFFFLEPQRWCGPVADVPPTTSATLFPTGNHRMCSSLVKK